MYAVDGSWSEVPCRESSDGSSNEGSGRWGDGKMLDPRGKNPVRQRKIVQCTKS